VAVVAGVGWIEGVGSVVVVDGGVDEGGASLVVDPHPRPPRPRRNATLVVERSRVERVRMCRVQRSIRGAYVSERRAPRG
jgi:hypothetical protein